MRLRMLAVVGYVLATGCGLQPVNQPFTHYCSMFTHEPCLDQ
jgi:hypothetical protein